MKMDKTLASSSLPKYWTMRGCWRLWSSWISHWSARISYNMQWWHYSLPAVCTAVY